MAFHALPPCSMVGRIIKAERSANGAKWHYTVLTYR
jgi:hypothetical protein